MDNNELVKRLAYVHDLIEAGREDATPRTVAALVAVEAALEDAIEAAGKGLHSSYLPILDVFMAATPDSQFRAVTL